MLIIVAWRNIWRNKARSLVIMAAVAIGLWAAHFLIAFYNGMATQRIQSAIETELSHLQFHHPGFKAEEDIQFSLPDGYATLQQIQKHPAVKQSAGRLLMKGMLATASGSSGVQINGIMPEEESALTQLKNKLIAGSYFTGEYKHEMIIGEKLLKKMKLRLHAKAILNFQDKEGNIASGAFRITGIYKTVNTPYDELNVFVNLSGIDTLAGVPHQLNEIALLLHQPENIDPIAASLKQTFPRLTIEKWMEISPEMNLLVSSFNQMMVIYMSIILLALAFGIINTMLMAVLERTREIGMLMALGMNKLRVFAMILLETLFLVLIGCPTGILLALMSIAYTHEKGIRLDQFAEAYSSLGYSSLIYPALTVPQFFMMMLMVVITALLSSLFPAGRALQLKPVEAIRK